jgi:molybdopterin-guanine dinucleotide biosynthesis protein A
MAARSDPSTRLGIQGYVEESFMVRQAHHERIVLMKIMDCTALILAGGDSSRMGQDKAALVLDGKTLLESVATTMHSVFPKVIVSVRQLRTGVDLPQVRDEHAASGPLAGLAAGMKGAATPWIFAVACDMPFIKPALIEYLAGQRAGHQAVVPLVRGFPQPLVAFYASSCRDVAEDILNGEGKHSLRALLEKLSVCYVSEEQMLAVDPQLRSFFDLDTPQDVAIAMNEVKK